MSGVAIVGGGIGGLAAAIALQQRGIEAHVHEAAERLEVVGAGIWMPPNAMAVFERLGLADAIVEAGAPIWRPEIHDATSGALQVVDLAVGKHASTRRWTTVAIHRGLLQDVLASAVAPETLHLGRVCRALHQGEKQATLVFSDGSEHAAEVVIGADGLRSVVRQALFPNVALRYSGQTSYRAVQPFKLPPELTGAGREIWGPGRRFGFSAIDSEQAYWYATLDAPVGEQDDPGTLRAHLGAVFREFPQLVRDMVRDGTTGIVRTDLHDFRPLPRWHAGRVVLLGDAAHATTPNLGQGAAQAIEDAWVLAEQMSRAPDPTTAFAGYQRIRMPKARRVTRLSRQLGHLAHLSNRAGRQVRNAVLRSLPDAVARRQMEALFRLNY
jgi:2-polyprenyl-6-methoxyphenol hydroxylase-like FAD-dependent oxidoreductase